MMTVLFLIIVVLLLHLASWLGARGDDSLIVMTPGTCVRVVNTTCRVLKDHGYTIEVLYDNGNGLHVVREAVRRATPEQRTVMLSGPRCPKAIELDELSDR